MIKYLIYYLVLVFSVVAQSNNRTVMVSTNTGILNAGRFSANVFPNITQFATDEQDIAFRDPQSGRFLISLTQPFSGFWVWDNTSTDASSDGVVEVNGYATGRWVRQFSGATPTSLSANKITVLNSSKELISATGSDGEKTSIGLGNVSTGYNRLPYFYDDFSRPDTSVGSIGLPPMGTTYDLRRAGAVLPANQTRISSKKWTSEAGDIVYGVQRLPGQISRIGATFRFTAGTSGAAGEAVLALLVFPDATGANMIRDMGVHVTITRTNYQVQVRTNSTSYTLAGGAGSFPAPLAFDTTYTADILVSGNYMTCNLAGVSVQCNDSRVAQYSGNYAGWEHFYTSAPSAQLLVIESVWADSAPYATTSGQEVADSFKATGGVLSYYLGESLFAGASSGSHNIYGGSGGLTIYDSSANPGLGVFSAYMSSAKEHYFLNGIRLGTSVFAGTSANFNNIYGGSAGLALYDSVGSIIALGTSSSFAVEKPFYINNTAYFGTNIFAKNESGYNKVFGGASGLALSGSDGVAKMTIHTNSVTLDSATYLNSQLYARTNKFLDEAGGINNVYGGPSGLYFYDSAGGVGYTMIAGHITIEKPLYINDPVALGASGSQFTRIRRGTATLTAGSVTVADATVTASSEIYLSHRTPGGTPGWLHVSARSAGVNFTVTSSSGTDTSVISYLLVEP